MRGLAWLVFVCVLASCTKRHAKPDEDLYATSRSGGDRGPSATVGTGATAQATPAAWPPHLERWAALTRELSALLQGAGSCADVARQVRTFVGKNGSEFRALQRQLVDWERAAPPKDVSRFYRGVMADLNVRIDAGIRCKDDATARAAFDQFFQLAGLDLR